MARKSPCKSSQRTVYNIPVKQKSNTVAVDRQTYTQYVFLATIFWLDK